jgi:uncharacterized damage-inducible protein DinB
VPSVRLQRPDPSEYNPRFENYVASVPDAADFRELLRDQVRETVSFITAEFGEQQASLRYAPDKWTVREVIGHLSDCERIFAYRALRFARGDSTVLSSFDENAYVPAGAFERRSLQSVLDEFVGVRAATIGLVDGLTEEQAARSGNLQSGTTTVRALLYVTAGHELHHRVVLREKYLPRIATAATR